MQFNRRSLWSIIGGGAVALMASAARTASASVSSLKSSPENDPPLCSFGNSWSDENSDRVTLYFFTEDEQIRPIAIDGDTIIKLMGSLHFHLGYRPEAQLAWTLHRSGKCRREISQAMMRDDDVLDMLIRAGARHEANVPVFAALSKA